MNKDTGEIITFESKEEYDAFMEKSNGRFVPVAIDDLTEDELKNKQVEDTCIKDLLVEIGEAAGKPRATRRRLEKKLAKLRKSNKKS